MGCGALDGFNAARRWLQPEPSALHGCDLLKLGLVLNQKVPAAA